MLDYCRAGRKVVEEFLASQNRIRWIEPEGAFYGFLQIEGLTNSLEFASNLVKTARVGVSPGSAFAPPEDTASDACVRICFGQDPTAPGRRAGAAGQGRGGAVGLTCHFLHL